MSFLFGTAQRPPAETRLRTVMADNTEMETVYKDLMPDSIDAIVRGLRAGYPLPAALDPANIQRGHARSAPAAGKREQAFSQDDPSA